MPNLTTDRIIKFSKTRVEALPAPRTGRTYYHDAACPGLMLAVTSAGAKSFCMCRRVGGKPQRVHLGRFPIMTVEQAQIMAAKVNAAINCGGDPQAAKRAKRGEQTFQELFDHYMEYHAKPHKKTWQEDERIFNTDLVRWHKRRLSEITRQDVLALHQRKGKTAPVLANRIHALVHKVFNHAIDIGMDIANPAARIKKFREEERERYIVEHEMRRFLRALAIEPDPMFRDFFLVLLLTGARKSNVQAMKWNNLDLDGGMWRISSGESKNKQAMLVVLPPPIVQLLRRRRALTNGSQFVFPGSGRTGHMVEPKSAWRRICERAKLVDVRMHDLRRTLASWQAQAGSSLPIIGHSLGQRSDRATRIYARLDFEPVRRSVTAAAEAILEAGDVKLLEVTRKTG